MYDTGAAFSNTNLTFTNTNINYSKYNKKMEAREIISVAIGVLFNILSFCIFIGKNELIYELFAMNNAVQASLIGIAGIFYSCEYQLRQRNICISDYQYRFNENNCGCFNYYSKIKEYLCVYLMLGIHFISSLFAMSIQMYFVVEEFLEIPYEYLAMMILNFIFPIAMWIFLVVKSQINKKQSSLLYISNYSDEEYVI